MRLKETVILYKRPKIECAAKGEVVNVPLSSNFGSGWCSTGGCYAKVQKMTSAQATYFLFNLAMHLIVRDGIDSQIVHNAFCEIQEYRDGLSDDSTVPQNLKKTFNRECEEKPDRLVV